MNPKSTCRSPKIARVVIGSNYLAFHGDPVHPEQTSVRSHGSSTPASGVLLPSQLCRRLRLPPATSEHLLFLCSFPSISDGVLDLHKQHHDWSFSGNTVRKHRRH